MASEDEKEVIDTRYHNWKRNIQYTYDLLANSNAMWPSLSLCWGPRIDGSTAHVNFRTSKEDLYQTAVEKCHVNWVVLDSDWEAEFCRVAETHPKVLAYVKNHNLGLEVPYRFLSESRTYIPDFIVLVDDGHGPENPLHLIVEIKGYRKEDAKEKKSTMDTYWIPGVNNQGTFGRWAFAEFTDVYEMQDDFEKEVAGKFDAMI